MINHWLDFTNRYSANVAMVSRLRVAVRVVSEDEYLAHLAEGPPGPGVYRGEKKFPVIIPNPQQWQIGHLAAEVKRQFKQIYGRDIGTIKYLSHGLDDCQLHKDLSVYEHLYDEGRARTDSRDQNVVVKAIFAQGHGPRQGSVEPDFSDPRHEQRPLPPIPVPSWSETSTSLGKRPAQSDDDDEYFESQDSFPDAKRRKSNDLRRTESEYDIAQSVEHEVLPRDIEDVLPTSQTVIRDSQSSSQDEVRQLDQRSFPAANGAALVDPPHLPTLAKGLPSTDQLNSIQSMKSPHDQPKSNDRKNVVYDPNQSKVQELLTPPSDVSKKNTNTKPIPSLRHGSKGHSSTLQTSSSGLGGSSTAKPSIFDMEQSEQIECSLMSPNSKLATNRKLSRSASGSKQPRSRKDRSTPTRFEGTVPNSVILRVLDDGGHIPSELSKRPGENSSYTSLERSLTADKDGLGKPGEVFQVPDASIGVIGGIHRASSKRQQASRSEAFSVAKRDGFAQPTAATNTREIDPKKGVSHALQSEVTEPTTDHRRTGIGNVESNETAKRRRSDSFASDDAATLNTQPVGESKSQKKKRRKQSQQKKNQLEKNRLDSLMVETGFPDSSTKQSTPVDSPGEQLLEMQASSQKSAPDLPTKASKKLKTEAKVRQVKPAAEVVIAKASAAGQKGKQKQMTVLVNKNDTVHGNPVALAKATKELTSPGTSSSSPYARPSPPKGSIGLGFTASPRRTSGANVSGSSLSPRKLFQNAPVAADTSKATETGMDPDSSDSEDPSSGSSRSTVATPSKQSRHDKSLSPYQRYLAKPKPATEPEKATPEVAEKRKEVVVPESNPEATGDPIMPAGWTKERYDRVMMEALQNPKPDPPAKKTTKSKAKSATPTTEPPKPQARKPTKKELVAKPPAAASESGSVKPAAETPQPATVQKEAKKPGRPSTKATSTPSVATSEHSKASKSAPPAKATQAPSTEPKATETPTAEPVSLLKRLKHKVAGDSARNSPTPPTFAPAATKAAQPRNFMALGQESDDDDDSSSDDDDEVVETSRAKIVAAARPDQSTRSVAVESTSSDDDDDDDD